MPNWIHHTHAGFVLVAYAVAAAALMGLAVVSGLDHRRVSKEWRALSQDKDKAS